ncbi:MAG: hypothetical protein Q7R57_03300 [Dehalococcoidales bacterium]|nr:hypothetical protein [Dehalococcoidales bacterium]
MKTWLFSALAALMLLPWPVAYAYDNVNAVPEVARVEAAPASAAPAWTVFGGAIGGVDKPGELFYVDATGSPADVQATLYLTNSDKLIHSYRYLTLKVGIYVRSEARWSKITGAPDMFITMQNGRVDFALPGRGQYQVTIDGGSFNAVRNARGDVSPEFNLTVE